MTRPAQEPPHLGDMFIAGLDVRVAARLDRLIQANPDRPALVWWELLGDLAASAAASRESPGCLEAPSPSRPPRMQ